MRWRIAALLALLCWLVPQASAKPDAHDLLAAAAESGLTPSAFYISAQRRVPGDASGLYAAAERTLRGVEGAQVMCTLGEGETVVAIAIVCEPIQAAAEQAVRQLYSALGRQAEIIVCLTGRASGADSGCSKLAHQLLAALSDVALEGVDTESYASHTGEWAQAAVRKNGDVYLGIPLIPLEY